MRAYLIPGFLLSLLCFTGGVYPSRITRHEDSHVVRLLEHWFLLRDFPPLLQGLFFALGRLGLFARLLSYFIQLVGSPFSTPRAFPVLALPLALPLVLLNIVGQELQSLRCQLLRAPRRHHILFARCNVWPLDRICNGLGLLLGLFPPNLDVFAANREAGRRSIRECIFLGRLQDEPPAPCVGGQLLVGHRIIYFS